MVAVRSVVRAAALRIPPIRRVYQTMQFAAAEASAARARIVELDTRIANSVAETHAAVATVNAARAEEIDVLRVLLEAAERERDLLAARLAEVRARAAFAETRMSEGIDTTLAEIKRLGARFANLTAALPIAAVPHSNKTAAVQLYLDLIEAALTGVLVEDPSMAPWTETSFD
ncbi:MAG: hypothetical protein ACREFZ_10320, partial [Acetobacteraceae bacterium]